MHRVIRPSSLSTFGDCARRFAARHLPDVVEATGHKLRGEMQRHIGAAVGTAVHAGIAYTLTSKKETGDIGNATEAEHRVESALVDEVQGGADWDDTSPNLSTAKQQAARMVRTYRRFLAPAVAPLLIEQRLEADVGDGWQVSGQADLLTGDPDEGIRDNKTGTARRWHGWQYGAYAIVFEAHGYRVPQIHEDFIQRVPLKREQPPPVSIEVDRRRAVLGAWDAIAAVKSAVATFEQRAADPHGLDPLGAFLPNPSSSLCGQRWCPAWGTQFCRSHT